MSNAAEPPTQEDPELLAKKREADIAEAEARIQKALKEIAQHKKEAGIASDSDLLRSEQEKAKAQAQQAVAEAEKAKFMANLPAPNTKPLEGKVDIDDKAGYFADILAYESIGENAEKIAEAVKAKLGDDEHVYLVKQPDYLKAAIQLQEIEKRLTALDETFKALLDRYKTAGGQFVITETPGALALMAAPAILGTLADVAALFRVDRSIKGRQPSVPDEALMAEVAHALGDKAKDKRVEILRPSLNAKPNPAILSKLQATQILCDKATLRLAEIRGVTAGATNQIEFLLGSITEIQAELIKSAADFVAERNDIKNEIRRLKDLYEKTEKSDERSRLSKAIQEQENILPTVAQREREQRDKINRDLSDRKARLETQRDQKAKGDLAIAQLDGAIKAFSDFNQKLLSIPDGGTTSPLASLAEACIVRDFADRSLLLSVSVVGQGGEVETRRSIWTSGKVYHRAGTACSYVLFDKYGKVITSGLVVSNRQTKEGKPIQN